MGDEDPGGASVGALEPVLRDEETLRYVLTSSKGIEYTTVERTTTFEPNANNDTYAVVTDYRILFLVGSDAEEPSVDIELDLESLDTVDTRSGLLNSSLVVVSQDSTRVKFTPSDGPELSEVADYIERIGESWQDLRDALAATRDAIEEYERLVETDGDPNEALNQARSRLSNAHYHATKHEDAPVEQMEALVEPVEARLDALPVEAHLDRFDERLATAESTDEDRETVSLLLEASERLAAARDACDRAGADGEQLRERIERRDEELDAVAASFLAEAEEACHRAAAADDPAEAAEHWERALERYRVAIAEGWDDLAGVGETGLRFQLAWVVGGRVDALAALADRRETEAENLGEDSDEATEQYERAIEAAERARDLAAEHPQTNADSLDERIADLQEKKEVSEWQWGDA